MTVTSARIQCGKSTTIQTVELYTKEEAKEILKDKEWEIGIDIYSTKITNKRIGWLASFGNGDGIYVET